MATPDDFVRGQRDRIRATPTAEAGTYSAKLVESMYQDMQAARPDMDLCFDYIEGDHLKPYAPRNTTDQIRDLQKRSIANMMPLLVNLPAQMSFIDDYRRREPAGKGADGKPRKGRKVAASATAPEWDLWQKNRMDGRQSIIYRSALTYGHSFVVVNNTDPKNIRFDILSTRNTMAYFLDPVNDIRPSHVLTIVNYARDEDWPGLAILWDDVHRQELTIDFNGKFKKKGKPFAHGLGQCPVVRYTCFIDDEGRTKGVVEPAIPLQDRINQATFDTNITSGFGSFKVRYAAGLVPNYRMDPENPDLPLLDPVTKQPIPIPIEVSQANFLLSDDPQTKFGELEGTPLDGYLRAEDKAATNFTMISQFPPLASVSNLANLSAEAWTAVEAEFIRWIDSLHVSFGESTEELMRTASLAIGDAAGAESYGGEVRWRDMTTQAFGAYMDGLGKAVQMLGVPRQAAWAKIPGMTAGEIEDWKDMAEEQLVDDMAHDKEMAQANASLAQKSQPPTKNPKGPNGNTA